MIINCSIKSLTSDWDAKNDFRAIFRDPKACFCHFCTIRLKNCQYRSLFLIIFANLRKKGKNQQIKKAV
jgi:hypothetical protein